MAKKRPPADLNELEARIRNVTPLLWQAYQHAQNLRADPWKYAETLDNLSETGLSDRDFERLAEFGFIAHDEESTRVTAKRNGTARNSKRSGATRVILTPAGAAFLAAHKLPRRTSGGSAAPCARKGSGEDECEVPSPLKELHKPHWSADDKTLCFEDTVIKRFKQSAPSQGLILATFEEEFWASSIDNPLPMKPHETEPAYRKRFKAEVRNLNRAQHGPIRIHFSLVGHGDRAAWSRSESATP